MAVILGFGLGICGDLVQGSRRLFLGRIRFNLGLGVFDFCGYLFWVNRV
jgi:hypothetical protein